MGREESTYTTDRVSANKTENVEQEQRPKTQIKYKSITAGSSKLEGKTKDLGTNVFQIHGEQRKSGQFNETMEAIKVFCSNKYVGHIDHLTPLFTELK